MTAHPWTKRPEAPYYKSATNELIRWRMDRSLTQAAAADVLGVARTTVVRWERDGPPWVVLAKIRGLL